MHSRVISGYVDGQNLSKTCEIRSDATRATRTVCSPLHMHLSGGLKATRPRTAECLGSFRATPVLLQNASLVLAVRRLLCCPGGASALWPFAPRSRDHLDSFVLVHDALWSDQGNAP